MPIHRIPRVSLDEDLRDIIRVQCERVLSVAPDGDFYIVVTELAPLETRDYTPVFHASRGGAA